MAISLPRPRPQVHPETVDGPRPDPEVPEKVKRRQFTAEHKLRILEETDRATEPGQIGALLRREGLYSSRLVDWRRQWEWGTLIGRRPGRKGKNPLQAENEALRAENERLRRCLEQVETVIEVQKRLSRLLGIEPQTTGRGERL